MMTTPCFTSSNANYTTPHSQQFSSHYVQAWQSLWFDVALMGTIKKLFMTLQVLLPITLSRLYSQVLSQAGVPGKSLRYCPQVVPPFSIHDRCTALPNDLDGPCGRRTWAFTDKLLDTLDSKTLWDEYSIDNDILVCKTSLKPFFSDSEIAFHSWLSMHWHPWNPNTQFIAPSYQRNLQRSPRHLGRQVSCP